MDLLTRPERLALLVSLLGDEAAEAARAGMSPDKLSEFDESLDDFKDYPPSKEEIDSVLDYFNTYFELAIQSADEDDDENDDDSETDASLSILKIPEEQFDVEIEPTKTFEKIKRSGNTVVDLNRMHPYQVAFAIKNEQPEIATLVIRKLADPHAAKTIEFLPDALRPAIVLQLSKPSLAKPLIEDRILDKTLEIAMRVESREVETESSEKIAKLMRSLPRSIRTPMMDELVKQDAELAAAVKGKLYLFEDLNKLDPKDLQKLLGQCVTDSLVLALQNVDPELLGKVLGNMSKRAKEALQEEMEFKQDAKEDEIEEGRQDVIQVLIELVESGEISLD